MDIVSYYEIVLKTYNNIVMGRVRYSVGGEIFESQWYTIPELNDIISLWGEGKLMGSFGIHQLSKDATFSVDMT